MNRTYIKIWIGVFFVALALSACGPGKAEKELKQQEDLAKEVLAIHDEVMPRMGELVKLRKQLKERINQWTADSAEDHSEHIQKATELVGYLDNSDKNMMDWMHEYNGGQGLYEHQLIMDYLNEQKVKIGLVRDEMNLSMEKAQKFLDESGPTVENPKTK